jgi:hypothetical protein
MSNPAFKRKKIKQIKEKDRTLTLFTITNLALMTNMGTIGIIKAVTNLHNTSSEALTSLQVGTEFSTLIVTCLFVLMAVSANRIGRSKKHNELMVKGHEQQTQGEMSSSHQNTLLHASQRIVHVDTAFTAITVVCALTFLLAGTYSISQKAQGNIAMAASVDLIAYSAYIMAVLLTILNKVTGDKLQSRVKRQYLDSSAA